MRRSWGRVGRSHQRTVGTPMIAETIRLCAFCDKRKANTTFASLTGAQLDLCGRCRAWAAGDRGKMAAQRVAMGMTAEPPPRKTMPRSSSRAKVYFIQAVDGGPIKIGWAEVPKCRLADIQIGNPQQLVIVGILNGGERREREIHTRFRHLRIRGEWFENDDELVAFINEARAEASVRS